MQELVETKEPDGESEEPKAKKAKVDQAGDEVQLARETATEATMETGEAADAAEKGSEARKGSVSENVDGVPQVTNADVGAVGEAGQETAREANHDSGDELAGSVRGPHARDREVPQRIDCPYLGTINRNVLDFDFEKLCSVSLSGENVYVDLVDGKYFQGRGKETHAHRHALEKGHYVWMNVQDWRRVMSDSGVSAGSRVFLFLSVSLTLPPVQLNPSLTQSRTNKQTLNRPIYLFSCAVSL